MRIGITGDTHGSIAAMEKIAKLKLPLDLWLHTGDFYNDAAQLEQLVGIKVEAVPGNNDFGRIFSRTDLLLSQFGCKIFLTHGHKYSSTLLYKAQQEQANIVVYGHTHVPEIAWYENILFINPGSPAYPRRGSRPSFAELELFEDAPPQALLHEL